jgi:hypothetical protein
MRLPEDMEQGDILFFWSKGDNICLIGQGCFYLSQLGLDLYTYPLEYIKRGIPFVAMTHTSYLIIQQKTKLLTTDRVLHYSIAKTSTN